MEKYELVKDIGYRNFGVARLMRKDTKRPRRHEIHRARSQIDENVAQEIMNHKSLRHPNIILFKEQAESSLSVSAVQEDSAKMSKYCNQDLKLENTLLDGSPAPRLKICAFGCSKLISSSLLHSRPKSTMGSPAYIAPEVLSQREYDGKRLTTKDIKSHPWFLKNLPRELTEAAQAMYYRQENPSFFLQSIDDIMKIVEKPKHLPRIFDQLEVLAGAEKKMAIIRKK